jgi:hypothetical protein
MPRLPTAACPRCFGGALLLLTKTRTAGPIAARVVLLAGALLGISAGIKIWGVVVAAAVLVWTRIIHGVGRGMLLLAGAGIGATMICLPFFAAAPGTMWRMVVVDQLGRPRSTVGAWQAAHRHSRLEPATHRFAISGDGTRRGSRRLRSRAPIKARAARRGRAASEQRAAAMQAALVHPLCRSEPPPQWRSWSVQPRRRSSAQQGRSRRAR